MEAFEAWWRAKFPGEAEKWDDTRYLGTEWREKHLLFLREVRREAWDAGVEWERCRRAMCLANAPNLERLREMEDLLKVGASETATHNATGEARPE